VTSVRRATLIAVGLLLAVSAGAARAQTPVFKHVTSIYGEPPAGLRAPEGVACLESGDVVVADTGNGRLATFLLQAGQVVAGPTSKVAEIGAPTRLQADGKGTIWVLDARTKRIGRVDKAGAFAGWFETRVEGGATVVPASFRIDAQGQVWVLDLPSMSVRVFDPQGTQVRQVALPRDGSFTDLCLDAAGTVYAVDPVTAVVWSAEKGAQAFKQLGKSLKDVASFPTSITTDGRGRLFLVDQNGMGVVVLGIDGAFIGRQLGMGWSEGLLYYPRQLCINDKGEAFLADRNNNRVQVFTVGR
jgi:sugar lactone lactonase YvrE